MIKNGRKLVISAIKNNNMAMDELDQHLIALLRQDARLSIADLAHKLHVSRGTVNNRMRKLQEQRVILGYTVRLRPEAEPERIRAWMGVQVEGNVVRQVTASLLGEPGVVALHDTNGRWDLLAEIEAPSTAGLSQVLERIRLVRGIRNTETSIHLATYR
jgi:DNA-binding Lrp family transcriptional regulator